jgi:hypothetical protein
VTLPYLAQGLRVNHEPIPESMQLATGAGLELQQQVHQHTGVAYELVWGGTW